MQHDLFMTIKNCVLLTKNGWFPKNIVEKGKLVKKINDMNFMSALV